MNISQAKSDLRAIDRAIEAIGRAHFKDSYDRQHLRQLSNDLDDLAVCLSAKIEDKTIENEDDNDE